MKKISVLFATALFTLVSFAQPQAGSFGVELNFNPFGIFLGGNEVEGVSINPTFSIDGLKVRYFINDNMAIRGTLDFSSVSNKDAVHDADNNLFSTTKEATTTFGLTPGFEYHITKFAKGSVYVGAEIGFAVGGVTSTTTFEKPDDTNINTKSKGGVFGFGAGIFTGVDYYLTQNLYIGAELGLAYDMLKTTPNKSTTAGSTTVESKDHNSVSSFGFNCNPSFRLGWTF